MRMFMGTVYGVRCAVSFDEGTTRDGILFLFYLCISDHIVYTARFPSSSSRLLQAGRSCVWRFATDGLLQFSSAKIS